MNIRYIELMQNRLRIILSFFFLFGCYDNNRIDSWEIQKRIAILVEAKASQCGNRPVAPLLFTQDRPPGEVTNCEIDILNSKCPFKTYPWSCARIF